MRPLGNNTALTRNACHPQALENPFINRVSPWFQSGFVFIKCPKGQRHTKKIEHKTLNDMETYISINSINAQAAIM